MHDQQTRAIILMGVSGAGKTTIGRRLAKELGWTFYDGDDFHPKVNVRKMRGGEALTDDDRRPWLRALQCHIADLLSEGEPAVVACSALKEDYRKALLKGNEGARVVYLKGSYTLIEERLKERRGHFFDAELLASQFEALEEPKNAIIVDISQSPKEIVREIEKRLDLEEQAEEKDHREADEAHQGFHDGP